MSEYFVLKEMIKKGVAFHHSGLFPLFKECIELLLSYKSDNKYKPLIKVLFATETFAVGINMPTKSVCYSNITKFNNKNFRFLHSHEYCQMSGRAGRRGIDKKGYAILLPNLYNLPDIYTIKNMMNGKNQTITSKFIPGFSFILRMISTNNNLIQFIKSSLLHRDLDKNNIILQEKIEKIDIPEFNYKKIEKYNKLINPFLPGTNIRYSKKKFKQNKKKAQTIKESMDDFDKKMELYQSYEKLIKEKNYYKESIDNNNNYIKNVTVNIIDFLYNNDYLYSVEEKDIVELTLNKDNINVKGLVASCINECNEILFTEFIYNNYFNDLDEI